MSGRLLMVVSVLLLGAAYLIQGRRLSRRYQLNDAEPTPALARGDGVDFVPARAPVLFGHHFASIAGAGPIVGPVLAAGFGWLPVWLWVILGGILLGVVHDFSSLVASLRHRGDTIGRVVERHIGARGRLLFLLFSWLALLLVVAVFTILVGGTFTAEPAAATSSIGFLLLAIVFGFFLRRGLPLALLTLIALPFICLTLWAGLAWPMDLRPVLGPGGSLFAWQGLILLYVYLASVTPVHLLLQPRDYLNSFLLYALMAGGLAGILVADPILKVPVFVGFHDPQLGTLFPILFVTVACGAISGFHSLVSSGTTARQLSRESDARPVAIGAMLIECLLAVVALIVVGATLGVADLQGMTTGEAISRFAAGLASIMAVLGLPESSGRIFVSLAVSAFALTSLDTATRIARYLFQELAEAAWPTAAWLRGRHIATLVTVGAGALLLVSNVGKAIWPIFGAANQLLATLALLAVTVWLSRRSQGRDRAWHVRLPMFFMFAVTITALAQLLWQNALRGYWLLALMALLLLALSLVLAGEAWRALRRPSDAEALPPTTGHGPPADLPDCPC
ncbi:MAG: carbon starvation CstA family protein [bacterium]|nr:carbon starvation CstA family protein [bacterium]